MREFILFSSTLFIKSEIHCERLLHYSSKKILGIQNYGAMQTLLK